MSVGGKVIETVVCEDRVWVDTDDKGDRCAIYVERTSESRTITPGDSLWWQGRIAYWTPAVDGGVEDWPLDRIGYSGVSKP